MAKTFVVETQILENYGAHEDSGLYKDDRHGWKFKSGGDYIVHELDRPQDAMALVAAISLQNSIYIKQFPIRVVEYHEWHSDSKNDLEFYEGMAHEVRASEHPEIL